MASTAISGGIGTKKSSTGVSNINNSANQMSTNFSRKKSKGGLNSNNNGGGSTNGSQLGTGPSNTHGNFQTINGQNTNPNYGMKQSQTKIN